MHHVQKKRASELILGGNVFNQSDDIINIY
jgi:hypothetical protein